MRGGGTMRGRARGAMRGRERGAMHGRARGAMRGVMLIAVLSTALAAVELFLLQACVDAEVWLRLDVPGHGHGVVVVLGFAAATLLVGGVVGVRAIELRAVGFRAIGRTMSVLLRALASATSGEARHRPDDDLVRAPATEPRPRGARGPRAPGWSVRRPPVGLLRVL